MSLNDMKSFVINLIASTVFLFLLWLVPKLLGITQPISLIFIILGVLVGGFLGWEFHFLRTLRMAFVSIGGYTSDLNYLAQSTYIDMLGVTLHGFIDFKGPVKDAIFNNDAHVRVLLLDPDCEQFKKFAERLEPHTLALKGESQSIVRYIEELNQSIEAINKERTNSREKKQISWQIQYRYYDSIPFCGFIITNKTVRYWPYLNHVHASEVPTYHVSPQSEVAKTLANEFQRIWDKSHPNP